MKTTYIKDYVFGGYREVIVPETQEDERMLANDANIKNHIVKAYNALHRSDYVPTDDESIAWVKTALREYNEAQKLTFNEITFPKTIRELNLLKDEIDYYLEELVLNL